MTISWKRYKCLTCGREQSISTNHEGPCFDYCGRGDATQDAGCSWKGEGFAAGKPGQTMSYGGRAYREFACVEGRM